MYLFGAIPFGLVFVKIFLKQDLKTIGSGNTGTTNVLRTGSKKLTILTLICDMGKGAFAVYLASFVSSELIPFVVLAVVLGHNFSVFLKFKGGKGFATTMGLIFYFSPLVFLFVAAIWLLVAIYSSYSSLGALSVLVIFPFIFYFLNLVDFPVQMAFFAIAFFGIFRHRENMMRLIKGTEGKTDLSRLVK